MEGNWIGMQVAIDSRQNVMGETMNHNSVLL
jgi:hypothetical protein